MRHPAAVLTGISRLGVAETSGKRFALIGGNQFVLSTFRRLLSKHATSISEEEVDPTQLRVSKLRLRDLSQTLPFAWERPLIWIQSADHLFSEMSFPDDFPPSPHTIVAVCGNECYVPGSFTPVQVNVKGAPLQDLIRWMTQDKGMSAETEVIRFLASEYKDDLTAADKLLNQLYLQIHPRTVVSQKDLDADLGLEWDSTAMVRSIMEGDETKAFKEVLLALETFHPKGIVTILSRRVTLLIQIASNAGDEDQISEVKPWVMRMNSELAKEIPLARLFKWAVSLDKAYATFSRGSISSRWTMYNLMAEMCRQS